MNAVTKVADNSLPEHLRGGKQSKFGNVDQNDLIIPRVKLLQSTSDEVQAFDNAKIGSFWHTILESPLGEGGKLRIIPLIMQKELVLWAPRGDDRGVLARSRDLIHWDPGFENLKFEVKHKGMSSPVTYFTDENVKKSRLDQFGSKIPGDPDSPPAASRTYKMMFCFPDYPDIGPAVVINTRSSVKAAKMLISKIEASPVDHYALIFNMETTDEKGDEGPYKGYAYRAAGYADAEQYAWAKAMYDRYEPMDWKTNDDEADTSEGSGGGTPKGPAPSKEEVEAAKGKF
jgi:hypothetical protein